LHFSEQLSYITLCIWSCTLKDIIFTRFAKEKETSRGWSGMDLRCPGPDLECCCAGENLGRSHVGGRKLLDAREWAAQRKSGTRPISVQDLIQLTGKSKRRINGLCRDLNKRSADVLQGHEPEGLAAVVESDGLTY
jgi:hypothetical protein